MYLRISNPGVAPAECFTTLGVSTTRFSDNEETVGKFGSGSKHGVNLLLRYNSNPLIFCGKQKIEFYSRPKYIDDGLTGHEYGEVCYRISKPNGTSSKEERTGFTLEFGADDWDDLNMALREFVSNALDRTIRETGDFKQATVDIVDKPRGKDGYTHVYIPVIPQVQKFYNELGKRFLHFAEPGMLHEILLPKQHRNLIEGNMGPVIYKKGVLVREIIGPPSVFDYNLSALRLDESRNSNEEEIKLYVGNALSAGTGEDITRLLKLIVSGNPLWEKCLSHFYIGLAYVSEDDRVERKQVWQSSWKKAIGDNAVACRSMNAASFVEKKGYKVTFVPEANMYETLSQYEILNEEKVLTSSEREGKLIGEANEAQKKAVDLVWNKLVQVGLASKDKPAVKGFSQIMEGGIHCLGYYEDSTIYLNNDGGGLDLLITAVEETCHYLSGAHDFHRDFQDFLVRTMTKLMFPDV